MCRYSHRAHCTVSAATDKRRRNLINVKCNVYSLWWRCRDRHRIALLLQTTRYATCDLPVNFLTLFVHLIRRECDGQKANWWYRPQFCTADVPWWRRHSYTVSYIDYLPLFQRFAMNIYGLRLSLKRPLELDEIFKAKLNAVEWCVKGSAILIDLFHRRIHSIRNQLDWEIVIPSRERRNGQLCLSPKDFESRWIGENWKRRTAIPSFIPIQFTL